MFFATGRLGLVNFVDFVIVLCCIVYIFEEEEDEYVYIEKEE